MNCYEQLWTGLKSYEQLWTVSNSYEQLWTIMNSYEQLLKDINRYSQNISNLKDKFDVASYIGWHLSISESRFFRTLMSKNLRGGGNHPPLSETRNCSRTERLKPGCKFKFVRCLETYLRKVISLGHGGTLPGLFIPKAPRY